ncbi:MAG TPA: hypothetical protein PLJ62_01220, partial [Thermoflexales bacterium]|nr:hypothetical protein [Thermoflexales bacterium]
KYIRLESVLARLANGYTRKAGLNGGWMHEGILYRDVLYAYHVVIPVVAMPFEQLPRFKNLLAKEFRQIDIFMRCTPVFMV